MIGAGSGEAEHRQRSREHPPDRGSRLAWKLAAGLIVLFWLGTSGQLARLLIYPEEARMAEVPPEFVAGLFLGRAEPSQLVVLKGAQRIGEISIGTRVLAGGGGDAEIAGGEEATTQVSIAGWVNVDHPLTAVERVSGRLLLDFDGSFALRKLGLTLRVPGAPEAYEMEFAPGAKRLRYRSSAAGADGRGFEEGDFEQFKMLLAMNGIDIDGLGIAGGAPSPAMLEAMGAELTARRGQMTVRGERFYGYLLKIDLGKGSALRLTVSEAGELMRVQTFLDYELFAEVFVPPEPGPAETNAGE